MIIRRHRWLSRTRMECSANWLRCSPRSACPIPSKGRKSCSCSWTGRPSIRGSAATATPCVKREPRCPHSSPSRNRTQPAVRSSPESEEHFAAAVVAGGGGDRFPVVVEGLGRLDGGGEGAVGDQGGKLVVGLRDRLPGRP